MNRFKKYLSVEIGIEFKACLYFFAILFFYSMYRIMQGSFQASIAAMAEMIISTYVMGYIQVLFLHNFDERERISLREAVYMLFCSVIYTAVSWWFGWFDRNGTVTAAYFLFMLCCYISVFLVYKMKRDIDTAQLNKELEQFKNGRNKRNDESESGK